MVCGLRYGISSFSLELVESLTRTKVLGLRDRIGAFEHLFDMSPFIDRALLGMRAWCIIDYDGYQM